MTTDANDRRLAFELLKRLPLEGLVDHEPWAQEQTLEQIVALIREVRRLNQQIT